MSRIGKKPIEIPAGVDVQIDGIQLPTYWADGLVISTSSGSTATFCAPVIVPPSIA